MQLKTEIDDKMAVSFFRPVKTDDSGKDFFFVSSDHPFLGRMGQQIVSFAVSAKEEGEHIISGSKEDPHQLNHKNSSCLGEELV